MGWNCTNSRSATRAPARSARATPSPVATAGLVVCAKTWPMPPVARTTAGASTAPTPSCWPSPITCSVAPDAPVGVGEQVEDKRVLDHLDPGVVGDRGHQGAEDLRTGGVAAGVGDPVAQVPALAGQRDAAVGVVVEAGAGGDQLAHGGRAHVHSTWTAAGSQRPAPATRVSRSCSAGVSPRPGPRRCRPGPSGSSPPRRRTW